MYLLDPSPPPGRPMQRGAPQRKTVYRISLTLVKKELLGDTLLEKCTEEEGEELDTFPPHPGLRNFRTRSTGQLELGRLRVTRKTQGCPLELDVRARGQREERGCSKSEEVTPGDRVSCPGEASLDRGGGSVCVLGESLMGHKDGEDPNSRSPQNVLGEGPCQTEALTDYNMTGCPHGEGGSPATSGVALQGAEEWGKPGAGGAWESEKKHPSLLRRSFSFRHWNGELMKIRSLTRDKHHRSSSCLSHQGGEARVPISAPISAEKRNTLDVGEVLNKTEPLSDLERWERSKSKNRTLDNSDLHKLSEQLEQDRRGQERKLLRFFSGIFSRKDGTLAPFTSPGGRSPRTNTSRSRGYFSSLKRASAENVQSSTESVNGSPYKDAFVNSQEWTLSRAVPELKVGIVGNLASGKSALVHRYLTGTYVQEESPEGEQRAVTVTSCCVCP
ncbi:uncharacterized protein LOC142498812 [Ascaphus truei]|uniref:uncharacterized protein LOC142498812 n=1 Tax=Ascaphus truei TaxID=8439 RepID=UPI003F5A6695